MKVLGILALLGLVLTVLALEKDQQFAGDQKQQGLSRPLGPVGDQKEREQRDVDAGASLGHDKLAQEASEDAASPGKSAPSPAYAVKETNSSRSERVCRQ